MKKKNILITSSLIAVSMLAILAPAPVLAIPQPPQVFRGAVFIGDTPAADGLTVTATITGVSFLYSPQSQTSGGRYGDNLNFRIPADDQETPVKEGGVNGDTVVFYVGGEKAGTYTFQVGAVTELDLAVPSPARGRKSLPDPSTFVMVGSGLAGALLYIGFSGLRRGLNRNSL